MQIIITAAEQQSSRNFNRRLGRLIGSLPGADKMAAALIEAADEPVDFVAIRKAIDPAQFTITEGNDGDVVIWINPEAIDGAFDLVLEQYSIMIEIGIALYPIARLAKRLLTGLGEKFVEFAKRFERKVNPLLGVSVPVKSGGFNDVPVSWSEGEVVAVRGDNAVVQIASSQLFVFAKKDGALYYTDSALFKTISEMIENEVISDIPSWDFAE